MGRSGHGGPDPRKLDTMSLAHAAPPGPARTLRFDAAWAWPVAAMLLIVAFGGYAVFRAAEATHYLADNGRYHYASPFGHPDLTFLAPDVLRGLPILGAALASPGTFLLPVPFALRASCYYYRKLYHRGFFARPGSCAVPARRGRGYKGETGFFAINNLHRFALYVALVALAFNFQDAILSFATPHGVYVGLGTAILSIKVAVLAFYLLGCHSLRHLVGGGFDAHACDLAGRTRRRLTAGVTALNARHPLWAWASLAWVLVADLYVRHLAITGASTFLGLPA